MRTPPLSFFFLLSNLFFGVPVRPMGGGGRDSKSFRSALTLARCSAYPYPLVTGARIEHISLTCFGLVDLLKGIVPANPLPCLCDLVRPGRRFPVLIVVSSLVS